MESVWGIFQRNAPHQMALMSLHQAKKARDGMKSDAFASFRVRGIHKINTTPLSESQCEKRKKKGIPKYVVDCFDEKILIFRE